MAVAASPMKKATKRSIDFDQDRTLASQVPEPEQMIRTITSASGTKTDSKVMYKSAKPAAVMNKSPITPHQPHACNIGDSISDFVLQPKLLSSPAHEMSPASHKMRKFKKAVE